MKKTTTGKGNSSVNQHGHTEMAFKKLFEDGLKDIYWAEKALTKAIPKMVKKAHSAELKDALQEHLRVTQEQAKRLEKVFGLIGKKPVAKKCLAMSGIIEEGEEGLEENEGMVRDAGIILSAQKVEHYEIATYGSLCAFANTLGLDQAASLLKQTLDEEKEADETLSKIAETSVNQEALAEAVQGEE